MKDEKKKEIQQALESVRPYLSSPSELDETVEELLSKSSDIEDFIKKFQNFASEEENRSKKTDCKILLNKLQSQ